MPACDYSCIYVSDWACACVCGWVSGGEGGVEGGSYFVSRLLLYPLPLLSSDLPPVLLLNIVLL